MGSPAIQFENGEFYHIIKRGIERRAIFLDDEDKLRFINSLLVFNDNQPSPWESRAFWNQREPFLLGRNYCPKEPLAEIHNFVLMSNHFHLLLRQVADGGIVKLLKKLGGYVYYFNKKNKRQGTLFQGTYKAREIENETQLKNTFVYIATNPVEIVEPRWKLWEVKNASQAISFLENRYRWSSYWDYLGKTNFPKVIVRDFFLNLYGGAEALRKEINTWVQFRNEILAAGGREEFEKKTKLE